MNKKQSGFAVLESLLILIIIAIIGGTGYFVLHSKQQTEKTLDNASALNQTSVKVSKNSPDTASEPKFLTVKEYGVKFQLSDAIKDAYYENQDGYLYFSLHRFDSMKGAEGCRATSTSNGPLGVVSLTKGKVGEDNGTPAGGKWTQADLDTSGMKKVGDAYYGFQSGNAPCYNLDNPPSSDFSETIRKIKQEFFQQQSTFTQS